VLVKIMDSINGVRSWIGDVRDKRICCDDEVACSVLEGFMQGNRCHAPNRFGTVNMEDNVNIK